MPSMRNAKYCDVENVGILVVDGRKELVSAN
jgi:hypothetical protein